MLELSGHTDTVGSLAFSADGSALASGGMDGRVKVWEPTSGRCVQTLEGPGDAVEWLAWHPKGGVVLAGAADFTAWMWLAATGACMQVQERALAGSWWVDVGVCCQWGRSHLWKVDGLVDERACWFEACCLLSGRRRRKTAMHSRLHLQPLTPQQPHNSAAPSLRNLPSLNSPSPGVLRAQRPCVLRRLHP